MKEMLTKIEVLNENEIPEQFYHLNDVVMMLAQFKERHHAQWIDGSAYCSECRDQQWPCRTAMIVARWTGDDLAPECCTHWR